MLDTNQTISTDASQHASLFRNILVAVDGSHTGTRALELTAKLARASGASLAVVHVVDTFAGFSPQFAWGPKTYEAEYVQHGQTLLNAMVEKLPQDLVVTKILRSGDPSIEIARVAKQYGVDLLVIGGPSHHRLGRLLLGSVDEALIDEVTCAILVIPPDHAAPEKKQYTEADNYD